MTENSKILWQLDYQHNGDTNAILRTLHNCEVNLFEAKDIVPNDTFITYLDKEYPIELKQSGKPPLVLHLNKMVDLNTLKKRPLLKGKNKFSIESPITIEKNENGKLVVKVEDIEIWGGNTEYDIYQIALALCNKLAITEQIQNILLVEVALQLGKEIYITPTIRPSFNNELIKNGALLLDSIKDLKEAED